eukprot:366218-Chlamydomonas_euryale.AAC.2
MRLRRGRRAARRRHACYAHHWPRGQPRRRAGPVACVVEISDAAAAKPPQPAAAAPVAPQRQLSSGLPPLLSAGAAVRKLSGDALPSPSPLDNAGERQVSSGLPPPPAPLPMAGTGAPKLSSGLPPLRTGSGRRQLSRGLSGESSAGSPAVARDKSGCARANGPEPSPSPPLHVAAAADVGMRCKASRGIASSTPAATACPPAAGMPGLPPAPSAAADRPATGTLSLLLPARSAIPRGPPAGVPGKLPPAPLPARAAATLGQSAAECAPAGPFAASCATSAVAPGTGTVPCAPAGVSVEPAAPHKGASEPAPTPWGGEGNGHMLATMSLPPAICLALLSLSRREDRIPHIVESLAESLWHSAAPEATACRPRAHNWPSAGSAPAASTQRRHRGRAHGGAASRQLPRSFCPSWPASLRAAAP